MERKVTENDIHWVVRILTEDAELVSNRERFYSALSLPFCGLQDIKSNIFAYGSNSDAFFRQTLLKWISTEGKNATFIQFVQILNDECFRATADSIVQKFNNEGSVARKFIPKLKKTRPRSQISIWFDVPPRVMHFTGRGAILQQLHNAITYQNENRGTPCFVALNGMGGVGKTALTVEYAWTYQSKFYTNVAWIHADQKSALRYSFHRLAEHCGIKFVDSVGRPIGLDKLALAIYQHLGGNTLLIFDNVEHYLDIKPVLPVATPNQEIPHVLITSRLSCGMWSDKVMVISLDVFDEEESVEYLAKYLRLQSELEMKYAREISKLLHNIPLGIRQAGAFIKMQRETLGGSNVIHLKNYSKQWERNFLTALKYEHWARTEDSYEKTIYCTWNSSFSSIQQQNRLAIRIIQLVSYLNPDYIPNDLFYNLKRFEGKLRMFNSIYASSVENEQVDAAIKLLCSYSILTNTEEIRVSKIHRLIQKVVRAQTEEKFSFARLKEVFDLITRQLLKNNSTTADSSDQLYLIHAQSVLGHVKSCQTAIQIFDLQKLVLQNIESQLSHQLLKLENIYTTEGSDATFNLFYEFDKSYPLKGFAQDNQIYLKNYFAGFLKFVFNQIIEDCSKFSLQKVGVIINLGNSLLPIFTVCMNSLPTEMIEMNLPSFVISSVVSSMIIFIQPPTEVNADLKREVITIVLSIFKQIVIGKRKYYFVIFSESKNLVKAITCLRELGRVQDIQDFLRDITKLMKLIPDAFIESGFAKSLFDCIWVDMPGLGNAIYPVPASRRRAIFKADYDYTLLSRKSRHPVVNMDLSIESLSKPKPYTKLKPLMSDSDSTIRDLLVVALHSYYITYDRCLRGINYEKVFDCAAEIINCLTTLDMNKELVQFIAKFTRDVIEQHGSRILPREQDWFCEQAIEFGDKISLLAEQPIYDEYIDQLLSQGKRIRQQYLV